MPDGREEKRSRWFLEGVAVLLLTFSVVILVTNILPTRRKLALMREEQRKLLNENHELADSIHRLKAEAEALQNDPAAQQRAIRNSLRYREPGEKVIYFEDDAGEEGR
jgi:type II secretory pathway component PulM